MDDSFSNILLFFAGDVPAAPEQSSWVLIIAKVITVLLLVAANGFFVAAEFAFVGVRRSRIEALAAEGHKSAKRLLELLDNLNAYLSASQLGITLASLALGWLGEPVVAAILEKTLGNVIPPTWLHFISFVIAFRARDDAAHRARRASAEAGRFAASRKSRDGDGTADADFL